MYEVFSQDYETLTARLCHTFNFSSECILVPPPVIYVYHLPICIRCDRFEMILKKARRQIVQFTFLFLFGLSCLYVSNLLQLPYSRLQFFHRHSPI